MSSAQPASLLPEVLSKVAKSAPSPKTDVYRIPARLELAQLTEEIQDEAEALRKAGKLDILQP